MCSCGTVCFGMFGCERGDRGFLLGSGSVCAFGSEKVFRCVRVKRCVWHVWGVKNLLTRGAMSGAFKVCSMCLRVLP